LCLLNAIKWYSNMTSVLHVFLTDVCECYVLQTVFVCFSFFVFIVSYLSKFSVVIHYFLFLFICYLLYRILRMIYVIGGRHWWGWPFRQPTITVMWFSLVCSVYCFVVVNNFFFFSHNFRPFSMVSLTMHSCIQHFSRSR